MLEIVVAADDAGLDTELLVTVLLGAAVAVLLVAVVLLTLLVPVADDLETLEATDDAVLRETLDDVPSPPLVLVLLVNTLSAPVCDLCPLHMSARS